MITGWWYTYPSEKYEFVNQLGWLSTIYGKRINVPNQQPDNISLTWMKAIWDDFPKMNHDFQWGRSDSEVVMIYPDTFEGEYHNRITREYHHLDQKPWKDPPFLLAKSTTNGWLVVEPCPSEKYEFVSWDDYLNKWENKKCSKPPTRLQMAMFNSKLLVYQRVIRGFSWDISLSSGQNCDWKIPSNGWELRECLRFVIIIFIQGWYQILSYYIIQ